MEERQGGGGGDTEAEIGDGPADGRGLKLTATEVNQSETLKSNLVGGVWKSVPGGETVGGHVPLQARLQHRFNDRVSNPSEAF